MDFYNKMLEFLPEIREEYFEFLNRQGSILETVVIEDIFMPKILELLNDNSNSKRIKEIFDYFEEIVNGDDFQLINLLEITVFEIVGNDKAILKKAKNYMGNTTIWLQKKADETLGR